MVFCLACIFPATVNSFTHWVVTEDGRIQHQLESAFAMVQPDNLAAFLNQEETEKRVKEMHKDLLRRHEEIEANEDKDMDLESVHYDTDEDCVTAGKRFSEFDLFIHSFTPLSDKGIKVEDFIRLDESLPSKELNCSMYKKLSFSVHAYDHLKAVQKRYLLESQPLKRLKTKMEFLKNPSLAASAIHYALEKNNTSWVLYNMASFYWMYEGNTGKAVECIRRALHFSPEKHKDVALVNLANILHQSDFTMNATVVLLHALDISGSNDYVNYYHLANMFASLGNFNRSIYYYQKSLKFRKDFQPALVRLAAVKCELKLQEKLEAQHESLQRTLLELQEHRLKHEVYQETQNQVSKRHVSLKEQLEAHLKFEQQKLKEGSYGNICDMKMKEGRPYLVCEITSEDEENILPVPNHHQQHPDVKYGGKPLQASHARKVFQKIREIRKNHDELMQQYHDYQKKLQKLRFKAVEDDLDFKDDIDNLFKSKTYHSYYDYTHPDWPPVDSCKDHVKRYPQWDEFPSGYVDPQSRNFPVRQLLTSYIGLGEGEQHATPWKKPHCDVIEDDVSLGRYDNVRGIASNNSDTMWKQDTHLNNRFLRHVNNGTVWPDDIGQRILTALKKAHRRNDFDHKWVLYNLAGLFWRVNGDNVQAVKCLRRSVHHAPAHHKDVPLVGLANIMYRIGKTSDSLNLLIYALQVNNSEPVTYLSMGNVLQEHTNLTGAIQFYNYALVLHPDYKEALQSLLIVKCFKITGKRADGIINPNAEATLEKIRKAVKEEKEAAMKEAAEKAEKTDADERKCEIKNPESVEAQDEDAIQDEGSCQETSFKQAATSTSPKTVENTVITTDWAQTTEKCGTGTINWTSSTGERSCVVGKIPQTATTVSIASNVVIARDDKSSAADENETESLLEEGEVLTTDDKEISQIQASVPNEYVDNVLKQYDLPQASTDFLLQEAELLITNLSEERIDREKIAEKIDSAQKMIESLSNLQVKLSNIASTTDQYTTSNENSFTPFDREESCKNATKVDFNNFVDKNITEFFLYEMKFSLDVAVDGDVKVNQPHCNVNSEDANFVFDFNQAEQLVNEYSFKPLQRLDQVAKNFIEETDPPSSLAEYLARAQVHHPANWKISLLSALYWRSLGRTKQTYDCLQAAMTQATSSQCCDRDVIAYVTTDLLTHERRMEEAEVLAMWLLGRHGDSPSVNLMTANILAYQGRYKESLDKYERTLQLVRGECKKQSDSKLKMYQVQLKHSIQYIKCMLITTQH